MPDLALSLDRVTRPGPGWFHGDFHAHTHYSDGVLSPHGLLGEARREHMEFLTITDHNTRDAYPHFGAPADLGIVPGMEVTFTMGHYNLFGITQDLPWLEPVSHGPIQIDPRATAIDVNALLAAGKAAGLLNSINHPLLVPWAWLFPDTDLTLLHCLEIWNDPSFVNNRNANPQALAMWTAWLNAGHRIVAIGGSDFHRPYNKPGALKPLERLGFPRTYVYADALSPAALLDGVRRGRVYVSMGAQVDFTAAHAGQSYPIGADLGVQSGDLRLTGTVTPGSYGTARLLRNGAIVAEAPLYGDALTLTVTVRLDPATPAWFRLDVLDPNGLILAVTNPIFAGPRVTPTLTRYGDFVDFRDLSLKTHA